MTSEMLKPCPCGKAPHSLHIDGVNQKYSYACGSCCGEWHIEFRSNYLDAGAELSALACEAWNMTERKADGK